MTDTVLDKAALRRDLKAQRRRHVAALPDATRALLFRVPPAPVARLITPGATVGLYRAGPDEAPAGAYARHFQENGHAIALPRFAAAAAVSIIGAAPAVLAEALEKDRDDEISRETAENIGTNASDTVGSIMKDYIDIPTTISVDQGAVVMVMVNADLEML